MVCRPDCRAWQPLHLEIGATTVEESLDKISYNALHNIAYDKIKGAIRDGRLRPGDTLRTRTLAKALGISSTPVRDALSRLIAQNVLDVDPRNRQAMVPELTREILEELYTVRLRIEPFAAELAAENISEVELAHLKKVLKELEELEKNGESTESLEKSEEYFYSIYRATGNMLLQHLIDNLWLRSSVILGLLLRPRPADFSIRKERQGLVAALEKRDRKAANHNMEQIITRTRDMVFDVMANDPSLSKPKRRSTRRKA